MFILERLRFWATADRLGPDIPITHWKLFFPHKYARSLCQKKFRFFGEEAEFRPWAYAVNCSLISIGRRVTIRPNTMLFASGEIVIENDVLLGSGVQIYTSNHSFFDVNVPIIDQGHSEPQAVRIGRGSWLGANVIVLPGVTIGENAVIGAGSIVTKDVPSRSVYAGNPAKLVKMI